MRPSPTSTAASAHGAQQPVAGALPPATGVPSAAGRGCSWPLPSASSSTAHAPLGETTVQDRPGDGRVAVEQLLQVQERLVADRVRVLAAPGPGLAASACGLLLEIADHHLQPATKCLLM